MVNPKPPSSKNSIILLIGLVTCFLCTFIPLLIVIAVQFLLYTIFEAILPFSLVILSLGAFLIGLYSIYRQTSLLYITLYFLFHLIFSIFFALFSLLWLIAVVIEIVGIIYSIKTTSPDRKFFPNMKKKIVYEIWAVALIILMIPIVTYFKPPKVIYVVELRPQDAGKGIEINFTMSNNTGIPNDLLDILERSNELPRVNISLTYPIVSAFLLNVTKFAGLSFPDRDYYILPYSNYSGFDAFTQASGKYDKELNYVVDNITNLVSAMSYEELYTLPAENFDTTGLLAEQTRICYQHGITIDYMPIMGINFYINDKTIDRMNKTFTLFKRWVELSNLTIQHRGVIFDTEMDWGNQWNTIKTYGNYTYHEEGLKKLGDQIKMVKEWEYEWKNGTQYGPFSEVNWNTYILEPKWSYVGSATFGEHIDDLWDGDDAQQNLFKISVLPETGVTQFDFTGIMTYETGPNSDEAVYSYCRAGDFFFGERNVPYIYSGIGDIATYKNSSSEFDTYRYFQEITQKFQLIRNYGYQFMGIWGLMHFYCYKDAGQGWCGGLYDFLNAFDDGELIYQMCLQLDNPNPDPVQFVCDGYDFAYAHPLLTLIDVYLISSIRYTNWPIDGVNRIRPEEF